MKPAGQWYEPLLRQGSELELEGEWLGFGKHPGDSWIVLEGKLDLGLELEQARDTRTPIARLYAGDLLPETGSVDAKMPQIRFCITGHARLLRVPTTALIETLTTGEYAHLGPRRLRRWLNTLAAALPALPRPPHSHVDLSAGEQRQLVGGDSCSPRSGLVWVRFEQGTSCLLGCRELEAPADAWVPVSKSLWALVESDAAQVTVMAAHTAPSIDQVSHALRWLLHGLASALEQRARLKRDADLAHMRLRSRRDEKLFDSALHRLAEITSANDRKHLEAVTADDALLAACNLIGPRLGATFVEPASGLGPGAGAESLGAICRASRIRSRKVSLGRDWWRHDNGALLAFRKEDGRPVALLLTSTSRYELLDPHRPEQSAKQVDREVAATLRSTAYMFFPSLGDGRMRFGNLFRVAFRGLSMDIRLVLGASLAVSLAALVAPMSTKVLFDEVIPRADRGLLPVIAMFLIVVPLSAALVSLVKNRAMLRIQGKTEMNSESALMDRVLRLPASFFKKFLAGDLETRLMAVSNVRSALSSTVLTSLLSGVFSFASLGLVLTYDPKLAALGLVLGLISIGVILASSILGVRFNRKLMKLNGEIQGLVLQLFAGVSKLRVAAAERRAFAVWGNLYAQHKQLSYRFGQLTNLFSLYHASFPLFTSILFFLVIATIGGPGGPSGEAAGETARASNGEYMAALAAFGQFLGGILGLGQALISVIDIIPELERIRPLLEAVPESSQDSKDPGPLGGDIGVSQLSFRYEEDGPLVLDKVDLKIERGKMVAIVGPSGSGKSTLARLLLGMETPLDGHITFDGTDLADLDPAAVRSQMGTVMQGTVDLGGTIQSAILGGETDLGVDDAWEAARLAAMDEEIRALPMGMSTVLPENWTTFSGGQGQRLRLARALVRQPPILILDEATSAVDNRAQDIIRRNLEELGSTRVVIAHRLSTIRSADSIYVLDGGRIIESGNYEELMARDGRFASLARRQQL